MHNYIQLHSNCTSAFKKQEKAVAMLIKQFARKNYAIGFTFQSASKDFIN